MGTKTITITEEAYNSIKSMKEKKESFSDLFKRISKEKNLAEKCFGILKEKEEIKSMKKIIKKHRKGVTKDFQKKHRHYSRS